ncbi:MAG: serine/threonine protein kinase [Phycisphaerales bacterium]|nr:serine/threonine protein kinase [Phycisphaerales bacterium]
MKTDRTEHPVAVGPDSASPAHVQPQHLQLLEDSFHRAVDAPPEARQAIIDALASSHPSLARMLAGMLRSDGPDPTPALRLEIEWPPIPAQVGPYRVGERLGEGGFGVVHLAEQSEPVARFVAIKFIRRTTDGERFIQRFETERRALATLNHPCIPRLLDAGTAPDGRPYLVMEHVPGLPITRHCRERALPVEPRLRLMARVCDAVAHAHGKSVLHRDLKRGNVLVAHRRGWDEPKVIDFGISKIVLGESPADPIAGAPPPADHDRSLLAGTPSTTAPEQYLGAPADHRTDIYTIGLLLYELLTDAPPFPFDSTPDAAERRRQSVLNTAPTAPSLAPSPVQWRLEANRREHAPALDEVVLRCLHIDPAQRPPSASELADTLRAFPGEDDSAESIAAAVEHGHALEYGGDYAGAEREFIELVPRAARALGADHPLTLRAESLLAVTMQEQARHQEAETRLREVLERQTASLGPEHAETLDTLGYLAVCIDESGRTAEAAPMHRAAYEGRRRALGPDHPKTLAALNNLGGSCYRLDRRDEAHDCLLMAAEAREMLLGPDHPDALLSRANVGSILVRLGRADEAQPHVRRAADGFTAVLGADHPGAIIGRANLANNLRLLGRFAEAEPIAVECVERSVQVLGPIHDTTRWAFTKLLHVLDDRAAAEPESGAADRAAAWRARAEKLGIQLTQAGTPPVKS